MDASKVAQIEKEIEKEGYMALKEYIESYDKERTDAPGEGKGWCVTDYTWSCPEAEAAYDDLSEADQSNLAEALIESFMEDDGPDWP